MRGGYDVEGVLYILGTGGDGMQLREFLLVFILLLFKRGPSQLSCNVPFALMDTCVALRAWLQ